MNNLLTRQRAIDKASRLNVVQPTGLVPADYTKAELNDIEELLVHVNSAARFCRIDHAIYLNQMIEREYKRKGASREDILKACYLSNSRLAERYGVKAETLRSEISTMKQWPYEQRVDGLTVAHYRVIPAEMPRDIALQYLIDAAEEEWTVAQLQSACYEEIDSARTHVPIAYSPPATGRLQTGWEQAEQFVQRHEIERMVTDGPNRVVFHSTSGVLVVESDSPIRYITKENNRD